MKSQMILLVLAVAACGKNDASTSKESPSSGAGAKPAAVAKPCDYMPRADAEAAVGLALPQTNEGVPKHEWEVASCAYNSPDFFGVELIVRDWEGLADGMKVDATKQPLVPVAGLGDQASATQADDAMRIYVKKGNRGLVLTLNSPAIRALEDKGLSRAKTLALTIVPKI
jgi:hypothetical protein